MKNAAPDTLVTIKSTSKDFRQCNLVAKYVAAEFPTMYLYEVDYILGRVAENCDCDRSELKVTRVKTK